MEELQKIINSDFDAGLARYQTLMQSRTDSALVKEFEALIDAPRGLIDLIGEKPHPKQEEILKAVASRNKRIVVKSGHSMGKSYIVSRVGLGFFYKYFLKDNSVKVIILANTHYQAKNVVFREIKMAYRKLAPILAKYSVMPSTVLQSALYIHEDAFIQALSVERWNPVAIQGLKGQNILIIVDEASGLSAEVYEALDSLLAGGVNAKIMEIGNPLSLSGRFYDAFQKKRPNTITLSMGWQDLPHLKKYKSVEDILKLSEAQLARPIKNYEHLITPQYIYDQYMLGQAIYDVRCVGKFVNVSEFGIVSIDNFEKALKAQLSAEGEIKLGCDVGGEGGDKTVIIIRQGCKILAIQAFTRLTNPQVVAKIIDAMKKYNVKAENVNVDRIGIGAGVVDLLKQQFDDIEGINVGQNQELDKEYIEGKDREDFINLRAWLIFKMKWAFEEGLIDLPEGDINIDMLKQELLAINWELTATNKIKIESKDKIKEKIGRSTDFSDALYLTYMHRFY